MPRLSEDDGVKNIRERSLLFIFFPMARTTAANRRIARVSSGFPRGGVVDGTTNTTDSLALANSTASTINFKNDT